MKPIELVNLIKKSKPRLLTNITDEFAARIVAATLAEVRKEVDSVDEGPIKFGGLGRFVVRRHHLTDAPAGELKRRVIFQAANAKQDKRPVRAKADATTAAPKT